MAYVIHRADHLTKMNRQGSVCRFWRYLCLCLGTLLVLPCPGAAQLKQIRRVVILNDLGMISSPGYAEIDQAIQAVLQRSPYQIELYVESLEVTLFPDEVSQRRFREQFVQKYSDRNPDVIIAVGSASLKFVAQSQEKVLRDTPIVFCSILDKIPDELRHDMHFTGVLGRLHPEETLTAALHMLPGTKHVVVVGGMGVFDKAWEDTAKQAFQNFESKLDFTYLTNMTMPVLLERLKHLPNNTIVYHTAFTQDAAGQRFIDSAQSVPLLAGAANAPIFVMDDVDLRGGTVGGDLVNWSDDARVAAEMAVQVLDGAKIENIPIVMSTDAYLFDWGALHRWGIKETDLPPGSVVQNRVPGFWELYERYVIVCILLFLIQALVIVALLWQRAGRRRAETELAKSEEKFSKTFRHSPLVLAISRTSESRFIDVNDSFEEQLGWKRDEAIGRTPADLQLWANTDQLAAFLSQIQINGNVRDLETVARTKNGDCRTLLVSAEVLDVAGQSCTLSVAADISERKQAEEMLSAMSQRLIEAQEKERSWIARELHDDFNQRVALLSVNLEYLERDFSGSEAKTRSFMGEIKEQVGRLGSDIQALSHRLHSSKLDYLGLVSACKGHCAELSERQNLEIDFHSESIPQDLSKEISLCL